MRKLFCLLFGLFVISVSVSIAQNTSIIDDLNTNKTGQGNISIYQDEYLDKLLGKKIVTNAPTNSDYFAEQMNTTGEEKTTNSLKYVRAKGFRIQAYSGNNQRTSKNEAEARRNAIRSVFSGMDISVNYNSPIWRVKAGHFQTREQANQALEQMKLQFPSFGREMYVISDEIRIPVVEE